jgi:hypothetical protein
MKKGFSLVCCLAVLLGIASSAGASITIFNGKYDATAFSSWSGEFTDYSTENFSNKKLNDGLSVNTTPKILGLVDTHGDIERGHWNDTLSNEFGSKTTWNFDNEMYGFGGTWATDINDLSDYFLNKSFGEGISVTVYSNDTLVATFTNAISNDIHSPGQFWGFTSTTAFNRVVLSAGNQGAKGIFTETYNLDNLVYSSNPVSQTPVPAAAWIFITGLAGMLSLRRKNRK